MSTSLYKVAASINRGVVSQRPLIPPQLLLSNLPLSDAAAETVRDGREGARRVLHGEDDRLVVVVGPDSVHDVDATIEYARLLATYAASASQDLLIIMRVYFEHPTGSPAGWKGLINDPGMDRTFAINKGLNLARTLLLRIAALGLPVATTFGDTLAPAYVADLVTGAAVGARTTESQIHRELVSGLPLPAGFAGGSRVGVEACRAAREGHVFLEVGQKGESRIVHTEGNKDVHIVISAGDGTDLEERLRENSKAITTIGGGTPAKIMIDCADGEGSKHHLTQIKLAHDIAGHLSSSETGASIMGVVLASNLVSGRQDMVRGSARPALARGKSITGSCMSWGQTVSVLEALREGVRARRGMTTRARPF